VKYIIEFDASGQEARFMAVFSQDPQMLEIFTHDEDFHSHTGSAISGIEYPEFMDRKRSKDPGIVGEGGLRYCGKFVGLSNQYRVGAKKSRIMARVQYGLIKDLETIKRWQAAYHRKYRRVKPYWGTAIARAKETGYAETLAGRRFAIHDWSSDARWGSESSAINFPIQGSGADMKELALAALSVQFPQMEFAWDLHDGLYMRIDSKLLDDNMQILYDARQMLDNLPYKAAWGWTPQIPMTWDCAIGTNWGCMKELKWDVNGSLITE
jgi:DNA polymerase-1